MRALTDRRKVSMNIFVCFVCIMVTVLTKPARCRSRRPIPARPTPAAATLRAARCPLSLPLPAHPASKQFRQQVGGSRSLGVGL